MNATLCSPLLADRVLPILCRSQILPDTDVLKFFGLLIIFTEDPYIWISYIQNISGGFWMFLGILNWDVSGISDLFWNVSGLFGMYLDISNCFRVVRSCFLTDANSSLTIPASIAYWILNSKQYQKIIISTKKFIFQVILWWWLVLATLPRQNLCAGFSLFSGVCQF